MKIPYSLNCIECNKNNTHWAHINDPFVSCKCECGYEAPVHIGTIITIGTRLLYKAGYELDRVNDFSSAIIFSVMAFESEQLRLYKKWHTLDALDKNQYLSPDKVNFEIREIFRKAKNVKEKINNVVEKGFGEDFNEFVSRYKGISSAIKVLSPKSKEKNFLEIFHEVLFSPRNEIMHGNNYTSSKEEALAVYTMSRYGIFILRQIDQLRIRKKSRSVL